MRGHGLYRYMVLEWVAALLVATLVLPAAPVHGEALFESDSDSLFDDGGEEGGNDNISKRIHQEMMYGTDDYFGSDTDLYYADRATPTKTPKTQPTTDSVTDTTTSDSSALDGVSNDSSSPGDSSSSDSPPKDDVSPPGDGDGGTGDDGGDVDPPSDEPPPPPPPPPPPDDCPD